MSKLDGKVAVVIGGGTGIGLGCARALAESGCQVAIAGRRQEVLSQAVERSGGTLPMRYHVVDTACRESVKTLFGWIRQELGQTDIMVNSAAINIVDRTMSRMKPEQWDQVLKINTTGVYNCMQAVLPEMRERQDGVIINIGSIAGKRAGELGGVAYNASKFAVTALGTSVGNEDGRHGIRVTTVQPGEVNTPLLEQRPEPVSDERRATMLQPEDVGQVVAMIAGLPTRAHIPEVIIKPLNQGFA
jgi:NAD(P)-dependent dehydrogenase (short-subunit alcohol dehydrogenase family)